MNTRNGIFYDLAASKFRETRGRVTFVFSSRLHLEKFIERTPEARQEITESLSKRFGLAVDSDQLADLMLYRKIEKRGFYILVPGGEAKCLQQLKLSGATLTLTSCAEK